MTCQQDRRTEYVQQLLLIVLAKPVQLAQWVRL